MLTPDELELLTACVDGELTPRQRRLASRLLRAKPEARKALAELKGDSGELRALPPVPAPPGLHASVVGALACMPPHRSLVSSPRPAATPLPLWVGYAVAAAVVLAVGGASFLMHSAGPEKEGKTPVVRRTPDGPIFDHPPKPDSLVRDDEKRPERVVEEMPPPRIVTDMDPDEAEDVIPSVPTPPERKPGPVLASGQTEPVGRLERVEVALPRVHALHGLDGAAQAQGLRGQLATGPAFRVELPARDATRGLERVRQALAGKANVVIDAAAAVRLRLPGRADFAVYLEDITPEDLAGVLRAVGNADRAAALKKSGDRYFEGPLVVKELSRWDRRDLIDLLGVDPLKVRPAATGPGGRPPAHGVVMPLGVSRVKSAEVKKFLDARGPARPGLLQVLLVVRNVG